MKSRRSLLAAHDDRDLDWWKVRRGVVRGQVFVGEHFYSAPPLTQCEGWTVCVAADPDDARHVIVRGADGCFICDAYAQAVPSVLPPEACTSHFLAGSRPRRRARR